MRDEIINLDKYREKELIGIMKILDGKKLIIKVVESPSNVTILGITEGTNIPIILNEYCKNESESDEDDRGAYLNWYDIPDEMKEYIFMDKSFKDNSFCSAQGTIFVNKKLIKKYMYVIEDEEE